MESFVFNSFKKNLVEGKINNTENWYMIPVNSKFVDDYEDKITYFKTLDDFNYFCPNNIFSWDNYLTKMYKQIYEYTPMSTTDISIEPQYIDESNIDFFISTNPTQKDLKWLFFNSASTYYRLDETKTKVELINDVPVTSYAPRGFYYIRTSEELKWCAEKVNGAAYDNKINIVLGDNIGVSADSLDLYTLYSNNNIKKINYCIGSNPAQPFEGIFYGNGFKFINIELDCNNNTNGIFGYLGTSGEIHYAIFNGTNILKCNKKININHLTTDGSDIVAGLLCGKNNGLIDHSYVSGNIVINQFYPSMYNSRNKIDVPINSTETNTQTNDNSNRYYPDYLCYNNPGNIVPYIGYFNEGVFATYSGYNEQENKVHLYWNTNEENQVPDIRTTQLNSSNTSIESPIEHYYWNGAKIEDYGYIYPTTHPKCRTNILFYDSSIFAATNELTYSNTDIDISDPLSPNNLGFILWDEKDLNNLPGKNAIYAQYFDKSIKMTQQNRQAYYVSPLVGMNNSKIHDTTVDSNIYLSGTFVGFIGGIAGKQANGELNNINVMITTDELCTNDYYSKIGKQNPVQKPSYYLRDYISVSNYFFPQKSIKNIGGLFGSCVVGNRNSLNINQTWSTLNNNNFVISNNNVLEYDDYYFDNRYAAFAAVVEYNSCNIGDMWNSITNEINNGKLRSIIVNNSLFNYTEGTPKTNKHYKCSISTPDNSFKYGVCAPIWAEIKPTYVSVPSTITTPFLNNVNPPSTGYYRIGLYTVDQNFAAPVSDPNFWTINTVVDLPGVQNYDAMTIGPLYYAESKQLSGYAGFSGGIDRLNYTFATNFDLDIKNIATKLVYWRNSSAVSTQDRPFEESPFKYTTVPAAATIDGATYSAQDGSIGYCSAWRSESHPGVSAIANPGFNGNKVISLYPYFGSDLQVIPNVVNPDTPLISDLITASNISALRIIMHNKAYDEMPTTWKPDTDEYFTPGHYLCNSIRDIEMVIFPRAFAFAPFTTAIPTYDDIISGYRVRAFNTVTRDNISPKRNSKITVDDYILGSFYSALSTNSVLGDTFPSGAFGSALNPGEVGYNLSSNIKANCGWVFPNDISDTSLVSWSLFVIPFNFTALSNIQYNMPLCEKYPPFNDFHGFYVQKDTDGSLEASNWQSPASWFAGFYNTHSSPLVGPYEFPQVITNIEVYTNNGEPLQVTKPVPWYNLNISGSFRNNLLESNNSFVDPQLMQVNNVNSQIYNMLSNSALWFGQYDSDATIVKNYNNESSSAKKDFYKFTYIKGTLAQSAISSAIELSNVHYNYANKKAGFWFKNTSAFSGAYEFNDTLRYTPNILTLGKQPSQESILLSLEDNNTTNLYSAYGFKADDFAGLLFVRNNETTKEPIMYVDVNLGECPDGTSWSYSGYPSKDISAIDSQYVVDDKETRLRKQQEYNKVEGLLLEVEVE